jgi:hypothetical protein
MRLGSLGFLGVLLAWPAVMSVAGMQDRCEPAACVASISARVAVALAGVPSSEIAGLWKGGDGMLSGENLYLFADGSYIYTEWGDLLPETIYDKGDWRIEGGLVRFSPDAQVVWDPESDRRFAAVTLPAKPERRLIGLDGTLERFHDLVREHPDTTPAEWLNLSALRRKGGITAREAEALKRRLHEDGWRPGFFAATEDVSASEHTLYALLEIIDEAERVEALRMLGDSRETWLRAARKAFPGDPALKQPVPR